MAVAVEGAGVWALEVEEKVDVDVAVDEEATVAVVTLSLSQLSRFIMMHFNTQCYNFHSFPYVMFERGGGVGEGG